MKERLIQYLLSDPQNEDNLFLIVCSKEREKKTYKILREYDWFFLPWFYNRI